ncbi:MAG TPA: hypothetical protein DD396_03740 [Bacteroidetes bacterium]|jgi:hypothetical protein|nr:hypothetical protein [Bacteroidota bacterium]
MLFTELILRNQSPLFIKVVLLCILVILVIFYTVNRSWFISLKSLALLPFLRFGWQSEKYSADLIFRISSFLISVLIISSAIYSYNLTSTDTLSSTYIEITLIITLLFVVKFIANSLYFSLHNSISTGSQLVDFQYSLNQWFTLLVIFILLIDVFYENLSSNYLNVLLIVSLIYFLARLFGTILLLQNNFRYSIFTLFVYLCTFEIVPALVIVKVLFVNN